MKGITELLGNQATLLTSLYIFLYKPNRMYYGPNAWHFCLYSIVDLGELGMPVSNYWYIFY